MFSKTALGSTSTLDNLSHIIENLFNTINKTFAQNEKREYLSHFQFKREVNIT